MGEISYERDDTYTEYRNCVKTLLTTKDLSSFKSNPSYTYMLEHVSHEQGQQFYNLIKQEFNLSDLIISQFCSLNDKIGNPNQFDYSIGKFSPTSLRYIYHALLILSYCKQIGQNSVKMIEIGGGYGGLAYAINHLAPFKDINIESYHMIDLYEPVNLQKNYLSTVLDSSNFNFYNAENYGTEIEGNNYFLLSTYSLGEIAIERQDMYFRTLLPKVSHGFLIWNSLPYVDFGRDCKREIERPKTGPTNEFIYF
jgi:hypothetical protein